MLKKLPFFSILFLLCIGIADLKSAGAKMEKAGNKTEKATFAGGCFWCMQPPFDNLKGVISTTVGYTGGHKKDPTYEEVSEGDSGHTEAMEVVYDPSQVAYAQLLELFWKNIDPLALNKQFCDTGTQYRSAVFYHNEEQKKLAEATKKKWEEKFGKRIWTEIAKAVVFYRAEDYHQSYYKKNPVRYKFYRYNCGRDRRLEEVWGPGAGAH